MRSEEGRDGVDLLDTIAHTSFSRFVMFIEPVGVTSGSDGVPKQGESQIELDGIAIVELAMILTGFVNLIHAKPVLDIGKVANEAHNLELATSILGISTAAVDENLDSGSELHALRVVLDGFSKSYWCQRRPSFHEGFIIDLLPHRAILRKSGCHIISVQSSHIRGLQELCCSLFTSGEFPS